MARKKGARLVIDASVACAAGGESATADRAKKCRDLLVVVEESPHRYYVVLTEEIIAEWNNNQSSFARGWRRRVLTAKKVCRVDPPAYNELRDTIKKVAGKEKERTAMLEDFLLIKAALATDRIVISRDVRSRNPFAAASRERGAGAMKTIAWLNPDSEDVAIWLTGGAVCEEKQLLDFLEEAAS